MAHIGASTINLSLEEEEAHVMELRMRPRFSATTRRYASIPEALEALTLRFESISAFPCRIESFYDRQLEVHVGASHRHVWSPQLRIWLTQHDDHLHVEGIFGPESNIWTMFMAGYAVGGMTALGGALVLSSQMSLRAGPRWGGMILLTGLVFVALVYALSHVGRYFSLEQMSVLYHTLRDDLVEEPR